MAVVFPVVLFIGLTRYKNLFAKFWDYILKFDGVTLDPSGRLQSKQGRPLAPYDVSLWAVPRWLFVGDGKRTCHATFQYLELLEETFSDVDSTLARVIVDDEISFALGYLRGSPRFSKDERPASLIMVQDRELLLTFLELLGALGVQLCPTTEQESIPLFDRVFFDLQRVRNETTAIQAAAYIHVLISVCICIHRLAAIHGLESDERRKFIHLHLKRARVANSAITTTSFRRIQFPFPELVENAQASDSSKGEIDEEAVEKLIQIADTIGGYLRSTESADVTGVAFVNGALSEFYTILRVARSTGGKWEV